MRPLGLLVFAAGAVFAKVSTFTGAHAQAISLKAGDLAEVYAGLLDSAQLKKSQVQRGAS